MPSHKCQRCKRPAQILLSLAETPLCPTCWTVVLERLGWPHVYEVLRELAQHTHLDKETALALWQAWLAVTPLSPEFAPVPRGTLAEQVKSTHTVWTNIHKKREQYNQLAQQAGPAREFLVVFVQTVQARRWYRQFLRARFRYDAFRVRFLRIDRRPRTLSEVRVFTAYRKAFVFTQVIVSVALQAVVATRTASKTLSETVAHATAAMRQAVDALPHVLASGLEVPDTVLSLQETVCLAGWAATKGTWTFPRVQQKLDPSDLRPPGIAFLEQLPAWVLCAWADYTPMELLQGLQARIFKVDGTLAPSRNTRRTVPPALLSVEQIWLHEEARRARDLDTLTTRANLAPREAQIWDLVRQGLIESEIATRLGIDTGTVKTLKFRSRDKIRRAASD